MLSISSRGRKAIAALLTVSALGSAFAPTAASAHGFGHHGGHGHGFGIAGLAGGLLLGAAIASSDDRAAYERRCWRERQRFENDFGDVYYRSVRVCE